MTSKKLGRGSYGSVPRVLLHGPQFRQLPPEARFLLVFLKIEFGPSGIECHYPESLANDLRHTTGLPLEAVHAALEELRAHGWIEHEDNVWWIVEHLRYNETHSPTNGKHRVGIQNHLAGLPHIGIVRRFYAHYAEWFDGDGERPTWLTDEPVPHDAPTPPRRTPATKSPSHPGDVYDRLQQTWTDVFGPVSVGQFRKGIKDTLNTGLNPGQISRAMHKFRERMDERGKEGSFGWFLQDIQGLVKEADRSVFEEGPPELYGHTPEEHQAKIAEHYRVQEENDANWETAAL